MAAALLRRVPHEVIYVRSSIVLLFLIFVPLVFAGSSSTPAPPMLIWGEVNAPCALTTLSPSIVVAADYNGVDVSSVALTEDGNVFRFGGPSAADPKLLVPSEYSEVNVVLKYSSSVSPLRLGTVSFTSGVVYKYYVLTEANCSSLYPPAHYSVSLSLPSDCNGDLSGMAFLAYYGDTKIYSVTLSSGKSATVSFDVNGYKYAIPEGASLSFKVCKDTACTSWSEGYHYGKSSSVSQTLSCSAFFPTTQQSETSSQATGAGASSETNATTTTTTSPQTTTTTTTSKETNVHDGSTQKSATPTSGNEELNVNVPVTPTEHKPGIFGVPLDQAIVIAIVVIVALLVVIRFFV